MGLLIRDWIHESPRRSPADSCAGARAAELTGHELAALRLLASGCTHTQIAGALNIRAQTAGQLLHRAQTVLHARTLPHAVAIGYGTGLLGQDHRAR